MRPLQNGKDAGDAWSDGRYRDAGKSGTKVAIAIAKAVIIHKAAQGVNKPKILTKNVGGNGKPGAVGQKTSNSCGPACAQKVLREDGISVFQSNLVDGWINAGSKKGLTPKSSAQNLNKFQPGWKGGFIDGFGINHVKGLLESGKFISLQKSHFVLVESFKNGVVRVWDPAGGVLRNV